MLHAAELVGAEKTTYIADGAFKNADVAWSLRPAKVDLRGKRYRLVEDILGKNYTIATGTPKKKIHTVRFMTKAVERESMIVAPHPLRESRYRLLTGVRLSCP